jgi:hypothetical protein
VMSRYGGLIVVSLAVVMLAACGVIPNGKPGKPVERNTITKQQAIDRAEQIIRDTGAAVKPKPRLERYPSVAEETNCVDPTDGGSPDRTIISREYWLRDVPRSRNGEVAQQIKAYWDSKSYKITGADRFDTGNPEITGHTLPDEFRISLTTNVDGDMSIGTNSPCIWPNGTPEPSST